MMFPGAFVFVVLGMLGEVVYDEVDKGQAPSLRGCLIFIKCIKALLAAPTAFGTFLVAGRFSFSDEIAIFAWPF